MGGGCLRTGCGPASDTGRQTIARTIEELAERFRGRDDVMLIPHVGGRPADLRRHDRALMPVLEILSTHGEFEWLFDDVIAAGARVGIVCGSDDHTGRPGATEPGRRAFDRPIRVITMDRSN